MIEKSRRGEKKNPLPEGYTRDDYCTPKWVADLIGEFDLDPCWNPGSHTQAAVKLDKSKDGLAHNWQPYQSIFLNYPYSTPEPWFAKIVETVAVAEKPPSFVLLTPGYANEAMTNCLNYCRSVGMTVSVRPLAKRLSFEIAGVPKKGNDSASWLVFIKPNLREVSWAAQVEAAFEKGGHLV